MKNSYMLDTLEIKGEWITKAFVLLTFVASFIAIVKFVINGSLRTLTGWLFLAGYLLFFFGLRFIFLCILEKNRITKAVGFMQGIYDDDFSDNEKVYYEICKQEACIVLEQLCANVVKEAKRYQQELLKIRKAQINDLIAYSEGKLTFEEFEDLSNARNWIAKPYVEYFKDKINIDIER